MSDGTQTSVGVGGDLISDEDMTGQVRQSSDVPQLGATNAGYKIERTKIVTGSYGQDHGDANIDGRGLPIETAAERRLLEMQYCDARDLNLSAMVTRASEHKPNLFYSRCSRETGRI